MKNEKNIIISNVDILASIEFDLTEAIKDLIWNIKLIKQEVETIKECLPIEKRK